MNCMRLGRFAGKFKYQSIFNSYKGVCNFVELGRFDSIACLCRKCYNERQQDQLALSKKWEEFFSSSANTSAVAPYGTSTREKKRRNSALKQVLRAKQDSLYKKFHHSSTPVPVKKNVSEVVFKHKVEDDYRYMNNIQVDKAAQSYLIEEEEYAGRYMFEHLGSFKSVFEKELSSLIVQDHYPIRYEKIGDYYYYSERTPGLAVGRLCRKRGLDGEGQVILDFAALKTRFPRLKLVPIIRVSGDNKLVAYGIENSKNSTTQIQVCKIGSDTVLDSIVNAGNCEFDANGQYIFFTLHDENRRAYRIVRRDYLHSANERILYEERDPTYNIDLFASKDGKYFFVKSVSLNCTEIRYFAASDTAEPRLLYCSHGNTNLSVDFCNGYFYILETTSDGESHFYCVSETQAQKPLNFTAVNFSESLYNVVEFGVSNVQFNSSP